MLRAPATRFEGGDDRDSKAENEEETPLNRDRKSMEAVVGGVKVDGVEEMKNVWGVSAAK